MKTRRHLNTRVLDTYREKTIKAMELCQSHQLVLGNGSYWKETRVKHYYWVIHITQNTEAEKTKRNKNE